MPQKNKFDKILVIKCNADATQGHIKLNVANWILLPQISSQPLNL